MTPGGMIRRIAWVTGGGTGIGKALAAALYSEGHWVVISGRRKEILTHAAQEITSAHGSGDICAVPGDASDAAYVAELQRSIHERWGDIDLLINNAGENTYHSFQEASPEEFEQSFRVNCMSAIRCTQAVLPGMLARRSGAIVNVSSILGRWASASCSAYSVSKYALAGFTDALRQELTGSGVHVMGVYPGFILTPMTAPLVSPESPRWRMGQSPESMAVAILKGLRRGKREVLYPWYVPVALNLHHWFPGLLESLRKLFGR
jgi:short-subunit dehydrogenase